MMAAKQLLLAIVYRERDMSPVQGIGSRNKRISERYAAGETLTELARAYGLSPQRVHQIVRAKR